MTEIIETTAEPVDNPESQNPTAEELAMLVIIACGKDDKGLLTARPAMPPELMAAEAPLIREAIRATFEASWKKRMPALDARLETLEVSDLRLLLILSSCYFCLGRIQGMIEERQRADGENGENNG